jgi:ribosomal protein S18 acetylase RimI-like enzyme
LNVALDRIGPGNALDFKETRLRALQDAPTAFGSTYAKEAQRSDADWLAVAAKWCSERSAGFLAMESGLPCGIAGAFLDEADPHRAHLVSMWVAPTHRRGGVGRALIAGVEAWAVERGCREMQLTVTNVNRGAIRFYNGFGFSMTGRREIHPNDPSLEVLEMVRSIALA